MAKTKHEKEMETLDNRLDQQEKLLNEILTCIKGDYPMGIEGVIPALHRIEKKHDSEISLLKEWKDNIQKYFDVITGKPFRVFIVVVLIVFASMLIYFKFGATSVWNYFKWLLS